MDKTKRVHKTLNFAFGSKNVSIISMDLPEIPSTHVNAQTGTLFEVTNKKNICLQHKFWLKWRETMSL